MLCSSLNLPNSMSFDKVLMMVGLVVSFLVRADSDPCRSGTVQFNVTSTADLRNLTDALACSGEGAFDVAWSSSLTISQSIVVSGSKDVTVIGTGLPTIHGAVPDETTSRSIGDDGTVGGIFSVSNRSSLRLVNLVLEGGDVRNGGAVNLLYSSSLSVSGCTFVNNTAANGGETISRRCVADTVD